MNYVGRIQFSESYLEWFSLKIGIADLCNKGEKSVPKTGSIFFKGIKVALKSKIIVLNYM